MTTNDRAATSDEVRRGLSWARAFRFATVRLSEREAWFGTTIAVLFNAIGMILEFAIIRKISNVPAKPAAISFLVALILFMVLFIRRKTPSVRWASVVYFVNAVSVAAALALTNLQFAISESHWEPFQADKLGCLIAAMLAPGFWVGLLSVLLYAISALVQFEYFFPPDIQARVAAAEPWPIIAFALAGILALIYRFRRVQLQQEFARIQAQNFAMRRLASAFLNIRDLMNTPLQVLELSVELLRNSDEAPKPILDRVDRSVQSLIDLNSVLIQHEKEIESRWRG
jgi:hypothetical protein